MAMESDQAFLESVVKALVDNPEEVKVDRVVDEMGVLLTLDVHPDDMGKIIGRSGNTAKAIRTLLRVVGMKNNARVNLKINEPEGGSPRNDDKTNESEESEEEATESGMSSDQMSEASRSVDEAVEELKL